MEAGFVSATDTRHSGGTTVSEGEQVLMLEFERSAEDVMYRGSVCAAQEMDTLSLFSFNFFVKEA